ncbi:MAG TPA: hypothetical protein VFL57_03680 [Bryobacteraceae bacterium]|nr:hypothetical protein [Bryobacteraceae bacterium]
MRRFILIVSVAAGISASPLLARHYDSRAGYRSDKVYKEEVKRWAKEQRERDKAYRKAEKEREKQYRKMMRHPDRYRNYDPYYGYPQDQYRRYDPYGPYR